MSRTELPRILLLTTPQSYRAESFLAAADRLGVEVVQVMDMPQPLADQWGLTLGVPFDAPEDAADKIVAYADAQPVTAVVAVDDAGAVLAAEIGRRLQLPHNDPAAVAAARDKYVMRQMLAAAGVPCPAFRRFDLDTPLDDVVAGVSAAVGFPCVVKPLSLNGSRGVIRADNAADLRRAWRRVSRIVERSGIKPSILIETYIPGIEVALEGVLHDGQLQPLALFDKPDPLEGPYFEETIYVTPSRLPAAVQAQIVDVSAAGARALGLQTGSVHAELRVNPQGAWIVEVNGRSIGGLCSQTLRFDLLLDAADGAPGAGNIISLEELLLRQASGLDVARLQRESLASGVMMIPIPRGGILRAVDGIEAALSHPIIDEITITAPLNNRVVPLPEGESYLGFIFATGKTPIAVEAALRAAHAQLTIQIDDEIPLRVGTATAVHPSPV